MKITVLIFAALLASVAKAGSINALEQCQVSLKLGLDSGDDALIFKAQEQYTECLWESLSKVIRSTYSAGHSERILNALEASIDTYPSDSIYCPDSPCGTMWRQFANKDRQSMLERALKSVELVGKMK